MSDNITIARPYAKAIFNIALEHKQLSEWSNILSVLVCAVQDTCAIQFFTNPDTTPAVQLELLLAVVKQSLSKQPTESNINLIHLLVENHRVLLLPEIALEYERLRAEHEKTLVVNVQTFLPLTQEQHAKIVERLSNKLQRKVTLQVSIDPSLLGGIVICAGDLVIDDSVRSKLTKLKISLVA